MNAKPILVFIEGPAPTEEDRKLFEELRADQFVNSALHGSGIIVHSLAAAVNPDWIPGGYTTTKEEVAVKAPAPVQNPSAPAKAPREGGLGIQAGDDSSVGADGKPAKVVPNFGVQAK